MKNNNNKKQTKKNPEVSEMINIPDFGFKTISQNTEDGFKHVRFKTDGTFQLNHFALYQIFHGYQLTEIDTLTPGFDSMLLSKLAILAIDVSHTQSVCSIPLNRLEVSLMCKWLEVRMRHCEIERDQRTALFTIQGIGANDEATIVPTDYPKFNPDTYIAQRLLLLEMKEWLFGEIID